MERDFFELKMADYSFFYNSLLSAHSYFPYFFGGKALSPARVQFELTYRCNLKCTMCYQHEFRKETVKELATKDWQKIIGELPRYCLVTLIGGEPLVRLDVKTIIGLIVSKHPCNLVTNGILLTKDMAAFLVEKKLLLLGVSLDGIGEVHDSIRGVKGAFAKIVNNIGELQRYKKVKKSNYPLLDIKTVVMRENITQIESLYCLAAEFEADFFTISLPKVYPLQFNPPVRGSKKLSAFDFSLLDGLDFKLLQKTLKNIKEKNRFSKTKMRTMIRFYPNYDFSENLENRLFDPGQINRFFSPCRQPWSAVRISAFGDVYPCLSWKMGNIKQDSLKAIWNNKKFVDFRKELKKNKLLPQCAGCCYLKQKNACRFS